MKENFLAKYGGIIIILLIVSNVYLLINKKSKISIENFVPASSFNSISPELGNSIISCQFKVVTNFSFKKEEGLSPEDKIFYNTSEQTKPVDIIFAGLNTDSPTLKANGGEDLLKIVSNSETEMLLASSNAMGDVFLYKIFKDKKVATWYKSYDLLGTPYSSLSMGYCY